jgi:hypothetical protein
VLAAADTPIAACLLVLTLAPAVTVVGYELVGHRHSAAMLARSQLLARGETEAGRA